MIEFLSFNTEELYGEIKERARAQGAYTQSAWNDLVEEIVNDKRRVGEIADGNPIESIVQALQAKFADFRAEEGV